MTLRVLSRWLPPPSYLTMPAMGVDISDRSIKYMLLGGEYHHFAIKHYGEEALPFGLVENGRVKDAAKLGEVLKKVAEKFPAKYAVASLPEEQAFIVHVELPFMKKSEIRQSLEFQLDKYVPLPQGEAIFDYQIIKEPTQVGEMFTVVLSAVPRSLVTSYQELFDAAGLTLVALEIEAQAIARAVLPIADKTTSLIVDFGKTRTSFFITQADHIAFTLTVPNIGGETITAAIQKNLNVSYEQAEKLKIKFGLLKNKNNQPLFFSTLPIISALRDEVTKLYHYWNDHGDKELLPHGPIDQIIFCGGQATLPGLVEYFESFFSVSVSVANVWTNVLNIEEVVPPVTAGESQRYATSLGLALRQPSYD
jgi:type IV pilus assembly protein PilM